MGLCQMLRFAGKWEAGEIPPHQPPDKTLRNRLIRQYDLDYAGRVRIARLCVVRPINPSTS